MHGLPSAHQRPSAFLLPFPEQQAFCLNGLKAAGLPPHSLGYIYLPALAGIAVTSYLTAPLGAKLAHKLPIPKLKKGFAILLIATGCKMLYGLL